MPLTLADCLSTTPHAEPNQATINTQFATVQRIKIAKAGLHQANQCQAVVAAHNRKAELNQGNNMSKPLHTADTRVLTDGMQSWPFHQQHHKEAPADDGAAELLH